MQNEPGTAGEIVKAEASGGFQQYKETVYHLLENFFIWLSTHQGLALIVALIILAIVIYLIVKSKRYRKKIEAQVAAQKTEIGKKDTLISDQKNKLDALQKKLADQQNVVSESLLGTLMNLTGYNLDQLRTFVKFLTDSDENPVRREDTQALIIPANQGLEEEGENSGAGNDGDEKIDPSAAAGVDAEASKSVKE